jgi:hypothetical protein
MAFALRAASPYLPGVVYPEVREFQIRGNPAIEHFDYALCTYAFSAGFVSPRARGGSAPARIMHRSFPRPPDAAGASDHRRLSISRHGRLSRDSRD